MWQQQEQRQQFSAAEPTPEWLQAGYYQDIPHGEVNWALLAQRWITMRQYEEQENVQRQLQMIQQQQQHEQQFQYNRMAGPPLPPTGHSPFPPMPPEPQPPPPMPNHNPPYQYQPSPRPALYQQRPMSYGSAAGEMNVLFPSGRPGIGRLPQPVSRGSMGPPARGPVMPMPPRLAPPPFAPSLLTSDFRPPPGYVSSAPLQETGPVENEADFGGQWASQLGMDDSNSPEPSMIDVQMRKQLPAWIREGLEKMEKEKTKQQQMEKEEREAKEAAGADAASKVPKWRLEELEQEGDKDDDGDNSEIETKMSRRKEEASDDGEEQTRREGERDKDDHGQNAEEFKDELLAKLRYWMTSILMEVTSSEITDVVRTFYSRSRASAQPKVLAQSSALASILGFFDEDERDEASETSDQDENDNKGKDAFKMPMLPPASSKKSSATADVVNDTAVGSDEPKGSTEDTEERQPESSSGAVNANAKSSSVPDNADNDGKNGRGQSSSRSDESKLRKERRRKSRSSSRERGEKSKHSRDRHRRDRSRSRSASPSRHRRRDSRDEKSSKSKSHRDESERRRHSRHRSKSPVRHRR